MKINHLKKQLFSVLAYLFRPFRAYMPSFNPLRTEGSALVTAIILAVVVAMLSVIGAQLITTNVRIISRQEHQGAEADNIARAGLKDAFSWFRNQSNVVCSGYPVPTGRWADDAFNPAFSTNPASCSSIDTSIGLVKEFPLDASKGLYGRYEVCRQTNPVVAGVVFDSYAVHDITGQRYFNSKTGNGYAWFLGSKGYIYKAGATITTPCGGKSNFNLHNVFARSLVSTEIRRITLHLPNRSAVIVNSAVTPSNPSIVVNKMGKVQGGTFGVSYCSYPIASTPYSLAGGTVTGTYTMWCSTPQPNCTATYVLGVSTSDLQIMADYLVSATGSVPNPVNLLPQQLGSMSLVYIIGNATFGTSHPLNSSGILFVDGDLTLDDKSYSTYYGLIFCTGKVTVLDGAFVQGSIVAWNGLVIGKSGNASSEMSLVAYSDSALNAAGAGVGRYREMKSTYRVFSGIPNF